MGYTHIPHVRQNPHGDEWWRVKKKVCTQNSHTNRNLTHAKIGLQYEQIRIRWVGCAQLNDWWHCFKFLLNPNVKCGIFVLFFIQFLMPQTYSHWLCDFVMKMTMKHDVIINFKIVSFCKIYLWKTLKRLWTSDRQWQRRKCEIEPIFLGCKYQLNRKIVIPSCFRCSMLLNEKKYNTNQIK